MTVFEKIMYDGAIASVGDPMILGILVLLFFGGFVMLQNLPTSAKIGIIGAALVLAAAFFPTWSIILIGLAFAFVVFFGIMRTIGYNRG